MARSIVLHRMQRINDSSLRVDEGHESIPFGNSEPTDLRGTLMVHHPRFYRRILCGGGLGAAESYLRGEWSSPDLVGLFRVLARNRQALRGVDSQIPPWLRPWQKMRRWWRRNTLHGSRRNIRDHYDLGNDLFALFLDDTMTYSSGVFADGSTSLRDASIAKYDRICQTLRLSSKHRVIEIGSGWGGFAIHAAGTYGCHVTTTTISREQEEYAQAQISSVGLRDRISVLNRDYRNLEGQFDRLVSIEMIEAVGAEFLPLYFRKCASLLRPQGEMVLQAILIPDQRFSAYCRSEDFIQKYVFPGGCLPSIGAIAQAISTTTDLQWRGMFEFGLDYATTLAHWRRRFLSQLDEVRRLGYDERFIRLWDYYLAYCEAGFRERLTSVAQLHFARGAAQR